MEVEERTYLWAHLNTHIQALFAQDAQSAICALLIHCVYVCV